MFKSDLHFDVVFGDDFELTGGKPNLCPFAFQFSKWADDLIQFPEDPDILDIYQAKINLLDKYFDWYHIVPKRHRFHKGNRGHICIYQVFVKAYHELRAAELSLKPFPLISPPSSDALKQLKILGLPLGSFEDREDDE